MLKHENTVSRLGEREKIELLTNIAGMSETELLSYGLPTLKTIRLAEMTKNIYPAPEMLSCSWDDELIAKVGRSSAELAVARGVNFALTPAAKIKLDPYGASPTEDVCLGSSLAHSYAKGARSTGVGVCVEGMGVARDEVKWLGEVPDRRVLYEYIARPYLELSKKGGDISIGVSRDLRRDGFDEVGAELTRAVRDAAGDSLLVCESAGPTDTVRMINRQIVCLQGAGYALSAALRKYDIVKRAVDKGELEESELLDQIECGDAISPEMLDAAVDRLIDLLESCTPAPVSEESARAAAEDIAYRAAAESAVLLKNEAHALPITKKKRIALIGDIAICKCEDYLDAFEARLSENGVVVVGKARGYALDKDASDAELTREALALAKDADVVLYFVGNSEEREKHVGATGNLSLPANQDMLAQKLKRSGKTVVALLDGRCSVDIVAIEQLSALMTVSCASAMAARACADLVMGVISPSGKLVSTLYRNTDRSFSRREQQLGREVSVGRFIGYRYYDSADYDVGFPFGHGLSYTSFGYSSLSIGNGRVSLTVKNKGKRDGAEVVQIYAGLDDRDALCPKKELIAYKKVFLKAGESAKLSFDLRLPRVLDEKSRALAVRKGRYTVYAGSSLTDIRQSTKVSSEGAELENSGEPLARYLLCESNIITDNYTLEAKYPIMKRAIKNIISGVAMLLVAVLLQIYCVSTNTASAFLNILTVIVLGIAVAFFVLDAFDRKRMADNERALAEKENEKWFEDATHLESFDTEKMFEEEFAQTEEEIEEEEEEAPVVDVADEYLAYIDKDLTLSRTADELSLFALERGCKLEKRTVYTLLGALSSSRLVILNGIKKDEFSALAGVLCEYLECNFHMDIADSSYKSGESVFMRTDENGNKIKSGALRTVEEAGASQSELHVAPIANVSVEMLANCFGDIVKYAKNPSLPSLVSSVEGKYRFSKNILFLIGLDSQRTLAELPADVAEVATVCEAKLTLTDRAATLSSSHKLKLYQLEYMADEAAASSLIAEEEWKKLDAFERYVGERTGYAIGNKRWISIERYASVYAGAGGDISDSIDEAVASRLLPGVVSACKGKEISLGEAIESIFGENEMDSSCRAVRNSRLYAKDQGETNV